MYYVLFFIIIEPDFGLSVGFWISADLGLDLNFHPNYFWVGFGFRFGLWVWVPSHCIQSESDPLPSLADKHMIIVLLLPFIICLSSLQLDYWANNNKRRRTVVRCEK
jgi:hypothetical protein